MPESCPSSKGPSNQPKTARIGAYALEDPAFPLRPLGTTPAVETGWMLRQRSRINAEPDDSGAPRAVGRSASLLAARYVDRTTFGVIGHQAGTVRAILTNQVEGPLECLAASTEAIGWSLTLFEDEAELALCQHPRRSSSDLLTEFLLAAQHVFFAKFGPFGWRLRFVSFQHGACSDIGEYEDLFGVIPSFGAEKDRIAFDSSLLDAPMRCRAPGSSVTSRVRSILGREPDQRMATVALSLGLSLRTLQRALASEGTGYHLIADQVRRELAERLLSSRQPVCEVACTLGFNDVAAFHRAFRRWTGSTPGVFRTHALASNDKTLTSVDKDRAGAKRYSIRTNRRDDL